MLRFFSSNTCGLTTRSTPFNARSAVAGRAGDSDTPRNPCTISDSKKSGAQVEEDWPSILKITLECKPRGEKRGSNDRMRAPTDCPVQLRVSTQTLNQFSCSRLLGIDDPIGDLNRRRTDLRMALPIDLHSECSPSILPSMVGGVKYAAHNLRDVNRIFYDRRRAVFLKLAIRVRGLRGCEGIDGEGRSCDSCYDSPGRIVP